MSDALSIAGALDRGDLGLLGGRAGAAAARVRRGALRALGRPEALPAGLRGRAAGRAGALRAALRRVRPAHRARRRVRSPYTCHPWSLASNRALWRSCMALACISGWKKGLGALPVCVNMHDEVWLAPGLVPHSNDDSMHSLLIASTVQHERGGDGCHGLVMHWGVKWLAMQQERRDRQPERGRGGAAAALAAGPCHGVRGGGPAGGGAAGPRGAALCRPGRHCGA